jgi:hypothetical protein
LDTKGVCFILSCLIHLVHIYDSASSRIHHSTSSPSGSGSSKQDYRLHRDEIRTKLIAIMQERMHFHRRKMPQVLEQWLEEGKGGVAPAAGGAPEPSEFARALVKEVRCGACEPACRARASQRELGTGAAMAAASWSAAAAAGSAGLRTVLLGAGLGGRFLAGGCIASSCSNTKPKQTHGD